MTRDQLLADLRRALAAADPDELEGLLREIEQRIPDDKVVTPRPGEMEAGDLFAIVREAVTAAFPDRAQAILDDLMHRYAEAKVIAAVLPRTGATFDRVDGKGSTDQLLAGEACPRCHVTDVVHYVGSDCLEGSLEYNHLVHTEVNDWFTCQACSAAWSEYRFI